MKFDIKHLDSYSRGELLLRTFFGWIYIAIPHCVVLMIFGIGSAVLGFLAFWVVLFTGKYPKSWFDFQIKYMYYGTRVSATLYNLVDGYPAFGPNGVSDKIELIADYPEKLNQGLVILRLLFGAIYVLIPHYFLLFFRMIASGFIMFIAWWVVLFTGKYPENMHKFNVGTIRWSVRIQLYMGLLTDDYPKFSGKE
jgi:hypothetical protein